MTLDIMAILVISYGAYVGYTRGIIRTVFDTVSIVLAVVITMKFSPIAIDIVYSITKFPPAISFITGVVITFIGVMMLVRFVGKRIEGVLKFVHLNFFNKIAGAILQGLFFALILSFIILFAERIDLLRDSTKKGSLSYSVLRPLPDHAGKIFDKMKPAFTDLWDKSVHAMESFKSSEDE
ncbi:MAG TPA: CvpA family protein [Saprospiraceae bacterium]|nr:CvpA family protein [Saprospiraceae bacterium]